LASTSPAAGRVVTQSVRSFGSGVAGNIPGSGSASPLEQACNTDADANMKQTIRSMLRMLHDYGAYNK
jgi:hypothetical protein